MATEVINKKRFTKNKDTDITNQVITTSFSQHTSFAIPISQVGDDVVYDIGVAGVDGGTNDINITIVTLDLTKGDLTNVTLATPPGDNILPAQFVPRTIQDGTVLTDIILFHKPS